MNTDRMKWGAKAFLFGITAMAIGSLVVMLLWNWLIPSIFGLTAISYLQAMGLLLLSKILFPGFGRGSHRHNLSHSSKSTAYWKERFSKKMESMSHEDREAYKEKFMSKCGGRYRSHPAWSMFDQENEKKTATDSRVEEVF